jgi:CHAT domain-containing protein
MLLRKAERAISQLRLKLMTARSTDEVRRIRDQIFMAEQSRWVTPGVSILKAQSHETVGLDRIEQTLSASAVILEYVLANPRSYCMVISRRGTRTVPLAGKDRIEALVAAYLRAVKAKHPATAEARELYDALLRPISEAAQKEDLVVIRDGHLHLVPFDGFVDVSGRHVAETHTVIYTPSATGFYVLAQQKRSFGSLPGALLAVGGIPYSRSAAKRVVPPERNDLNGFSDLPASTDEVRAAHTALRNESNTLLLGAGATEAAFKRADLARYRVVHLAVHGFADTTHPDRAALALLSDPTAGEDGLLQSSEIVQLRFNAELVILSACDTAVGPLQGQEGIATLSRAFLLAGARNVVSTLWSIDDTASLFLIEQFYKHLATRQPAAQALTAAKRDVLRQFGRKALPHHWAGFTFEGVSERAISTDLQK